MGSDKRESSMTKDDLKEITTQLMRQLIKVGYTQEQSGDILVAVGLLVEDIRGV